MFTLVAACLLGTAFAVAPNLPPSIMSPSLGCGMGYVEGYSEPKCFQSIWPEASTAANPSFPYDSEWDADQFTAYDGNQVQTRLYRRPRCAPKKIPELYKESCFKILQHSKPACPKLPGTQISSRPDGTDNNTCPELNPFTTIYNGCCNVMDKHRRYISTPQTCASHCDDDEHCTGFSTKWGFCILFNAPKELLLPTLDGGSLGTTGVNLTVHLRHTAHNTYKDIWRTYFKGSKKCDFYRQAGKPCTSIQGYYSKRESTPDQPMNLIMAKSLVIEDGSEWEGSAPVAFRGVNTQNNKPGEVHITAKYEPSFGNFPAPEGECGCEFKDFTAGVSASTSKVGAGHYEAQITSVVPGFLNSFWLQGASTEINILRVEQNPVSFAYSAHISAWCFDSVSGDSTDEIPEMAVDFDLSDTFGLRYTNDQIAFFRNGVVVHSQATPPCLQNAQMNLIVSVEAPEEVSLPSTGTLSDGDILGAFTISNYRSFTLTKVVESAIRSDNTINRYHVACMFDVENLYSKSGADGTLSSKGDVITLTSYMRGNEDAFETNHGVCEGPDVGAGFDAPIGGLQAQWYTIGQLFGRSTPWVLSDSKFLVNFKWKKHYTEAFTAKDCAEICRSIIQGCNGFYLKSAGAKNTQCQFHTWIGDPKSTSYYDGVFYSMDLKAGSGLGLPKAIECPAPVVDSNTQDVVDRANSDPLVPLQCMAKPVNNNPDYACGLLEAVTLTHGYPNRVNDTSKTIPATAGNNFADINLDLFEKVSDGYIYNMKSNIKSQGRLKMTDKDLWLPNLEACAEFFYHMHDQMMKRFMLAFESPEFLNKFNETGSPSALLGCNSFSYERYRGQCLASTHTKTDVKTFPDNQMFVRQSVGLTLA